MVKNKLKTLKDIKPRACPIRSDVNCPRVEKEEIRTELGLKRIIKMQNLRDRYTLNEGGKIMRSVLGHRINLLMEIFDITEEDMEKFKEGNK